MPSSAQRGARTLLVGTDFSPESKKAVLRAIELGRERRSTVHLAHVTPKIPALLARRFPLVDEREVKARLAASVAQVRDAGVAARGHLLNGDVIKALVAKARGLAADLVIVGSRGRALPMTGSTAERLIELDRHRVLVVRRAVKRPYPGVLIAASEDSDLRKQAAAAALVSDAPATVLHAFEGAFETALALKGVPRSSLVGYRASARADAERNMSARLASAGLTGIPLVLRHGPAMQVLQRTDPDQLLVLSRGDSSVRRWLLGSVTRAVVVHGGSDLLLV